MNKEKIEMDMCVQRILMISRTREKLATKIYKIGYPNEYPEQFKYLEQAYINLDNAISKVIKEEAKALVRFV